LCLRARYGPGLRRAWAAAVCFLLAGCVAGYSGANMPSVPEAAVAHSPTATSPVSTPTVAPTVTPVATATASPQPTSSAGEVGDPVSDRTVEEGIRIYRAQYCGTCHALAAANTRGAFGPAHDQMGTVAAQRIRDPGYTGEATTAAGYILESLVDPRIYLVEEYRMTAHHMPAYTHLSEDQLDALVQLLLHQP
jgi:mono/diheme cytochrome c family protein